MTAADITSRPTTSAPAASSSAPTRIGLAFALMAAAGAAVIAVLRLALPYKDTDSVATAIAKIAAHPGRERLVVVLGAVGVLLLIPGYQALGRLTRDAAPRLTRVALALSYVGYLALGMVLLTDQLLLSAAGLRSEPGAAHLADQVQSSPFVTAATVVFVVGHVLGTVLLGAAFLRTRSIATWAAVAVTVAQPLHFVAAIVLGNHVLDFAAWVLTAVGFAVAGASLISRPSWQDQR